MSKKIIYLDWDGLIHQYITPWTSTQEIHDPPVEGAIDWLKSLLADHRLSIFIWSARNYYGGIPYMKEWLLNYGITQEELDKIGWPTLQKPAFHLLIDDNVQKFSGKFMNIEDILNHKQWNKSYDDRDICKPCDTLNCGGWTTTEFCPDCKEE